MSEVICIIRGDEAYVTSVKNPVDAFYHWRRLWPANSWLPVASLEIHPDSFREITGWETPITVPMRAAARVFGRVDITDAVRKPLLSYLSTTGGAVAPLLLSWHRAVQAVKEVGAPAEAVAYRDKHFPVTAHQEIYG